MRTPHFIECSQVAASATHLSSISPLLKHLDERAKCGCAPLFWCSDDRTCTAGLCSTSRPRGSRKVDILQRFRQNPRAVGFLWCITHFPDGHRLEVPANWRDGHRRLGLFPQRARHYQAPSADHLILLCLKGGCKDSYGIEARLARAINTSSL